MRRLVLDVRVQIKAKMVGFFVEDGGEKVKENQNSRG